MPDGPQEFAGLSGGDAMVRVRNYNDLMFGAFLAAAGAAGAVLVADLRSGTAMRMGPGYVPLLLSWLTIGFGILIAARGLAVRGPAAERWPIRPLVAVPAAIALFMAMERVGLVLAVIGVTLVACAGDRDTRWGQAVGLAIILATFASFVFVKGLGLPFPLWPAIADR
jgi:hypothetical protein